jgi:hypothetical protein
MCARKGKPPGLPLRPLLQGHERCESPLLTSAPRILDHWWPGNNLVAWSSILFVMYKLVEWRFLRMELPDLPSGAGRQLAQKAFDNL